MERILIESLVQDPSPSEVMFAVCVINDLGLVVPAGVRIIEHGYPIGLKTIKMSSEDEHRKSKTRSSFGRKARRWGGGECFQYFSPSENADDEENGEERKERSVEMGCSRG
jgi:hypothetical protein